MKGFLTTEEAAERLGLSRARVCYLVSHELLPAERIGKRGTSLIPETSLEAYRAGESAVWGSSSLTGMLTTDEAAERLQLSRGQVCYLVRTGRLAAERIGRRGMNLIHAASVAAYHRQSRGKDAKRRVRRTRVQMRAASSTK